MGLKVWSCADRAALAKGAITTTTLCLAGSSASCHKTPTDHDRSPTKCTCAERQNWWIPDVRETTSWRWVGPGLMLASCMQRETQRAYQLTRPLSMKPT